MSDEFDDSYVSDAPEVVDTSPVDIEPEIAEPEIVEIEESEPETVFEPTVDTDDEVVMEPTVDTDDEVVMEPTVDTDEDVIAEPSATPDDEVTEPATEPPTEPLIEEDDAENLPTDPPADDEENGPEIDEEQEPPTSDETQPEGEQDTTDIVEEDAPDVEMPEVTDEMVSTFYNEDGSIREMEDEEYESLSDLDRALYDREYADNALKQFLQQKENGEISDPDGSQEREIRDLVADREAEITRILQNESPENIDAMVSKFTATAIFKIVSSQFDDVTSDQMEQSLPMIQQFAETFGPQFGHSWAEIAQVQQGTTPLPQMMIWTDENGQETRVPMYAWDAFLESKLQEGDDQ